MNEATDTVEEAPGEQSPTTPADDGVRLVCAWCSATIKDGAGPVSHGICAACAASFKDHAK